MGWSGKRKRFFCSRTPWLDIVLDRGENKWAGNVTDQLFVVKKKGVNSLKVYAIWHSLFRERKEDMQGVSKATE